MKRRSFILNSALATGGLFLLSGKAPKLNNYNIVTIRGGSPDGMLDLGLEALGGIEHYVRKGQKVLIKPTLRWNATPESGENTNPDLLFALVKRCYDAGSVGVYLVDQTVDKWTKCYKDSGIERKVKDAGAKILPGNEEPFYQPVEIPGAKVMKHPKIHQIVQDVDVIINVPAVRPDSKFGIFGTLSNLTGLVWDFDQYQSQSEECMVDFLRYKKPVLNIVDACRVAGAKSKNQDSIGPTEYKTLILSSDIVAADAFAAKRLGIDFNLAKQIELAALGGFGQINPSTDKVRSIVLKNNQL